MAIALALTVFRPRRLPSAVLPPSNEPLLQTLKCCSLHGCPSGFRETGFPMIERDELDEAGKLDQARRMASANFGGADAIRLHGSGGNVRWASALGRQLTRNSRSSRPRARARPAMRMVASAKWKRSR